MRAIVTGVNKDGIGGAICRRLVRDALARGEKPKIVATATSMKPSLTDLVRELEQMGAQCLALTGDLADPAVPGKLVADGIAFCGGLDALVANAGLSKPGRLTKLSLEDWNRAFDVNTRATWLLATAGYEALKVARGSMLAIASLAGVMPHVRNGGYSASKAGMIMLVQQLALEWARDGIRVNAISPGTIRTPMNPLIANAEYVANREAIIPMGRLGTPEDIAGPAAFLLGPDAAFVTGENILVDGGMLRAGLDRIPIGRIYKV